MRTGPRAESVPSPSGRDHGPARVGPWSAFLMQTCLRFSPGVETPCTPFPDNQVPLAKYPGPSREVPAVPVPNSNSSLPAPIEPSKPSCTRLPTVNEHPLVFEPRPLLAPGSLPDGSSVCPTVSGPGRGRLYRYGRWRWNRSVMSAALGCCQLGQRGRCQPWGWGRCHLAVNKRTRAGMSSDGWQ